MSRALKSTGQQQAIMESLGLTSADLGRVSRNPKTTRSRGTRIDRPTVAQKLGLIQKPIGQLSFLEWEKIENDAISRRLFGEACPICMNLHGRKQSVITSCGHVFHKSCLTATKSRETESKCPMCRSLYKDKITKKGQIQAKNMAATRIQSFIRSFLTRRRLIRNYPMNKKIDFLSKEKISTRLSDYSRHAVGDASRVVDNSEFLIDQSDAVLKRAREIFSCITLDQTELPDQYKNAKIRAKSTHECPVCLTPFGKKSVSLLSCSHAIHEKCRIQLDKFMDSPLCPLCRQNYTFVNSLISN
jgi:hypothetical protein